MVEKQELELLWSLARWWWESRSLVTPVPVLRRERPVGQTVAPALQETQKAEELSLLHRAPVEKPAQLALEPVELRWAVLQAQQRRAALAGRAPWGRTFYPIYLQHRHVRI